MNARHVFLGVGSCALLYSLYALYTRRSNDLPSPTTQAVLRITQSTSHPRILSLEEEIVQNVTSVDESNAVLGALLTISEDLARKGACTLAHSEIEGYIHRSITCNHCNTSPVRGIRYKCANCPDFDLCEGCEGLGVHLSNHVFIKVRIPVPPLANPRMTLAPLFYPGADFTSLTPKQTVDWIALSRKTHCKRLLKNSSRFS